MFRNQKFNILTFLLLFLLLYGSYLLFIGIISPGGSGYSPFLDHYLNVPSWFTYAICSTAKFLLRLLGYNAYQKAPNNVSIHGSGGVNIIWACLGFGIMSVWAAFVVAHKTDWRYKIKWLIIGIVSIIILNIARIISIPLAFFYHWDTYSAIDVHLLFNIASYCVIFLLLFLFIKNFNRHYPKAGKS